MSEKTGTFVVTHADETSAVLRDVESGQIHTLAENPGLAAAAVLEATIAPQPPMEVAWDVRDVDAERRIELIDSDLEPTGLARELAADQAVGDVTRRERAGEGEIHVLTVPEERTDDAAADVLDDPATLDRAARLNAARVEVRTAAGVVSVRYLPE